MTKDDIIRMAEQAGWDVNGNDESEYEPLWAFANLVAAAEREAWPDEMKAMERQVEILTDALAEEREACAVMIENYALQYAEPVWALKITEAIRARSQS